MMKNELEIINLNKQFKDVKALNNINYTFHNGIYGLLGPNGAGKSTLINAITDNIKRDSGSILWNGNEILRLGKKYRNELGYMPQQQGYYGEFTAYAFMMYLAGLKGLDKKEAKTRTEELLNEVNMYEFRNKTLEKMSGKLKQQMQFLRRIKRCLVVSTLSYLAIFSIGVFVSPNKKIDSYDISFTMH